jgi:hypothetical protein
VRTNSDLAWTIILADITNSLSEKQLQEFFNDFTKFVSSFMAIIINHQYYNARCGREKRRRIWFQPVASEVR